MGRGPCRRHSALGDSLASLPRFQSEIGDVASRRRVARRGVHCVADGVDSGDPDALADVGPAKLEGTRAAMHAVERALGLTGNHGLSRHNPLERHHRDVLCSRVHVPHDDQITGAVGRALLDQDPTSLVRKAHA